MELDKIPGLNEAVAEAERRENELREFVFSGLPETICGLDVQQLRIPHLRLLLFAKSPFIVGGEPKAEDVAVFLWIVSREYKQADIEARDAFVMEIGTMQVNWETGISEYLGRAFMDAPGGGKSRRVSPIVGMSAAWIHKVASAYGWTLEQIEQIPMAAIFQLSRLIDREGNPKANFVNRFSDKIRWAKVKEWRKANG